MRDGAVIYDEDYVATCAECAEAKPDGVYVNTADIVATCAECAEAKGSDTRPLCSVRVVATCAECAEAKIGADGVSRTKLGRNVRRVR